MTNKLKEIMDTFKDDFSNMWHLDDGITLHKLEDFIRESCTAYGRSLIPEDNMDGDINHSAAFGYFQCKNNILDRISQDELSLGEEDTTNPTPHE